MFTVTSDGLLRGCFAWLGNSYGCRAVGHSSGGRGSHIASVEFLDIIHAGIEFVVIALSQVERVLHGKRQNDATVGDAGNKSESGGLGRHVELMNVKR
jgi:hypothetical protein